MTMTMNKIELRSVYVTRHTFYYLNGIFIFDTDLEENRVVENSSVSYFYIKVDKSRLSEEYLLQLVHDVVNNHKDLRCNSSIIPRFHESLVEHYLGIKNDSI